MPRPRLSVHPTPPLFSRNFGECAISIDVRVQIASLVEKAALRFWRS
jgi:hypothetical protein